MKAFDRNRIVTTVFVINVVFWVLFAVNAWSKAVPFTDRLPDFEEILPSFKIGTWAVPAEMESRSIFFRTVFTVYFPSYGPIAGMTNWIRDNRSWDDRIGPISIGSYVLIGTMILSFIQWYIVAILIRQTIAALRKSGATAPVS